MSPRKLGRGTLVIVGVALDRSTPESFSAFEGAVKDPPFILDRQLVAGYCDFS